MKHILFIICLLFIYVTSVNAADISIGTSFYTHHFDAEDGLNESNDVIAIKYDNIVGCTFVNSEYNRSWFFGYMFSTEKYPIGLTFDHGIFEVTSVDDNCVFVRGNVYVGPLYGYDHDIPNIDGWSLGIAPTIEIGYKQLSLETMFAPFDGGVVTSMVVWNF